MLTPVPESVFWHYINERHSIYLKKMAGEPKPWTNDPILRAWKFTNVFRELDRGTTWLRTNFLEPHKDDDPRLIAFNICWYRMFNQWETGECLGWQTEWNVADICAKLTEQQKRGRPIFTGAHIVHSEPGLPKMESIVSVCDDLYHIVTSARFIEGLSEHRSMEAAFHMFQEVKHVGGFMAHEMVQDMVHTKLLAGAIDQNTWTNLGPGAKRGLERLQMPCRNQKEGLASMIELFERSRENTGPHVPDLELHCIEFCLCELSKYAKVLFSEGRPRSAYAGM